ncbi:hypothetical protein ABZ593_21160 [Streptomyces sp. NPDC012617]|uniref:hypothetical protein n=1 Tax=Streptomyces TaxID=1883 RepID=UPI0033FA2694
MNQHPETGPSRFENLNSVVCDEDWGESPFGWSEPELPRRPAGQVAATGPYGDPRLWEEVPEAITSAVVADLHSCGWTAAYATSHTVVVPLEPRACGLPDAVALGEHLYAVWGGLRPEWTWQTVHPNAPTGGTVAPLLTPPDQPAHITAQILRVLRTGRTLP